MLFIAAYYHPVENLTQQSFVWRCLASCITGKFCSHQSESYQAKCRQMSLLIGLIIVGIAKKNKYICSGESRPLAEGEQAGFLSLFLSAFLPSEILFYFLPKIRGGGGPGPSPRSATDIRPCFCNCQSNRCIMPVYKSIRECIYNVSTFPLRF